MLPPPTSPFEFVAVNKEVDKWKKETTTRTEELRTVSLRFSVIKPAVFVKKKLAYLGFFFAKSH